MRTFTTLLAVAFLFISINTFAGDEMPQYKNSSLPVEERSTTFCAA